MASFSEQASSLMKWYVRVTRFGTESSGPAPGKREVMWPELRFMMVHTRMNKVMTVANAMATEPRMLET